MDEGRKRTHGVIAAIFACRKLAASEGKPSPRREAVFYESNTTCRRAHEENQTGRLGGGTIDQPGRVGAQSTNLEILYAP